MLHSSLASFSVTTLVTLTVHIFKACPKTSAIVHSSLIPPLHTLLSPLWALFETLHSISVWITLDPKLSFEILRFCHPSFSLVSPFCASYLTARLDGVQLHKSLCSLTCRESEGSHWCSRVAVLPLCQSHTAMPLPPSAQYTITARWWWLSATYSNYHFRMSNTMEGGKQGRVLLFTFIKEKKRSPEEFFFYFTGWERVTWPSWLGKFKLYEEYCQMWLSDMSFPFSLNNSFQQWSSWKLLTQNSTQDKQR